MVVFAVPSFASRFTKDVLRDAIWGGSAAADFGNGLLGLKTGSSRRVMSSYERACYVKDREQTARNHERLLRHRNLLYWYRKLYGQLFGRDPGFGRKQVLEVGSGISPLKLFYPHVTTSDVLDLEYLDHVFDCHEIDRYGGVLDHSFDIVTATNVLHHLSSPLDFLARAAAKLKPQGEVVLVEPFCSLASYPLYRIFHHEGISFDIDSPRLEKVEGPLSSANQALPHMMFFTRPDWLERLAAYYDLSRIRFEFFSSLTYMAAGGVSHVFPIPHLMYRALFPIDAFLARAAPRVFAAFFITRLTAKGVK